MCTRVFAPQVLEKRGSERPWKYLSRICVESLTFGVVPPTLSTCRARHNPQQQQLSLSLDFEFSTSGAQALVRPGA